MQNKTPKWKKSVNQPQSRLLLDSGRINDIKKKLQVRIKKKKKKGKKKGKEKESVTYGIVLD